MRSYNDMFRPVFELPAMFAWVFSAISLLVFRPPMWMIFLVITVFLVWYRWKEAEKLYRFRASLCALRAEKVTPVQAVAMCRKHLRHGGLYIGRGFRWTQSHAETARMINYRDPKEIDGIPKWFPPALRAHLQPSNFVPLQKSAIGAPWIHGISPEEEELRFPLEAVEGHSLIAGTTGAGKTRFLELLSTSIIHNGDTLIVIDPKYDQQLVDFVRTECIRAGRKFLLFHPAFPSKSIRLDLMANWHTLTEPASRLGQLVDADGSFQAFAWKTLFRIFSGMIKDGSMPNIKSAKYYVQNGIEPMLESLLSKRLHSVFGPQWDQDLNSYKPSARDKAVQIHSERLQMLINKFRKYELGDETIDALIAMALHSKEHYSKMIQVLEPLMEMLGSDELGDMLSPDPLDLKDTRPIYNTMKIIDENAVLYMGLNSLSNKTIGSALGELMLADLASTAGAIYNFHEKKSIYLLVDEAGEVLNENGIQLLNKSRGAGIKAFLCAQTIADLEVILGSKARAMQALGNLNNIFSLRVNSPEMARYIADSFGKTSARRLSVSHSTSSSSARAMMEFSGSTAHSISEEEIPLVSPDLLMKLPGLQYFASLAGATVLKGRIPLILDK